MFFYHNLRNTEKLGALVWLGDFIKFFKKGLGEEGEEGENETEEEQE